MTRSQRFVGLWTLAVVATTTAFVLYLALRTRAVELGYMLGRGRAKQAQLRETRRVLQVEAVSYRSPERIEALAKGVLQMEEPPAERIFVLGAALEPLASVPVWASPPRNALPATGAPSLGGAR